MTTGGANVTHLNPHLRQRRSLASGNEFDPPTKDGENEAGRHHDHRLDRSEPMPPDEPIGPSSAQVGYVTHRELDLRFQFVEERIERRHEAVLARIDAVGDRLASEIAALAKASARTEQDLKGNFDRLDGKIEVVRFASETHRTQIIWTIIVLAAGSFIAALAAIWSTNSLIISAVGVGQSISKPTPSPASPSPPQVPAQTSPAPKT